MSDTPEPTSTAEIAAQVLEDLDAPNLARANPADPAQKAEAQKRKATKPKPGPTDWVPFVSVEEESVAFDFAGFPALRWGKRLAWRIPAEHRDNLSRHHFVQVNRIREATKDEISAVLA